MNPSPDVLINYLWILVSAALVFVMQGGFLCLETGLTRSKNNINVALKNLVDFGITTVLFWAFGYALMFGISQSGLFGTAQFVLEFSGDNIDSVIFFIFQVMFCGTAVTILSGAIAERLRFTAYVLVTIVVSGLIYPVFGHWAWNGVLEGVFTGWLGQAGFRDFAGSTVVHSLGGWSAFAILVIIGARRGRFNEDGSVNDIPGSNLPLAAFGVLLLWVGWFGFNGGSTLALNSDVILIVMNTLVAGAAGMTVAMFASQMLTGRAHAGDVMNGALAGLVAITASVNAVGIGQSVLIGAIGAIVTLSFDRLLLRLRIDDAVGAIPVHLGAGIWGTLAVGIFADLGRLGLEVDMSRGSLIAMQVIGIIACAVWAFGVTYIIFKIVDRFLPLRISESDEQIGLNISEHGARNDLFDLFTVMEEQRHTGDLSLRVPEEPFTQVGQIGARYNAVMAALEDAVNRTESIVRTAMDAIVTFSHDNLQIDTLNPAAEAIFGYRADQILGKPINALIVPWAEKAPTASDVYELSQLMESWTQQETYQELNGIRSDGSVFPMEVMLVQAGTVDAGFYTGTFRDITERKQAQTALEHSEQYFRRLIENASDLISIIDKDLVVFYQSASVMRILGYESEDVIGTSILVYVHPDDYSDVTDALTRIMRHKQARTILEFRMRHAGGAWRDMQAIFTNLLAEDVVQGIVINTRDITNIKQAQTAQRVSEARSQSIIDTVEEGYFEIDLDGRILLTNAALSAILEVPEEQLLESNLFDYMDATHVEHLQRMLADLQQSRHGIPMVDYQVLTSTGAMRSLEMSITPIWDQSESLIGYRGVARDVTERRASENLLRRQNEYLATLHEIAVSLMDRLDLDDLLTNVILRAAQMLHAPHGFIYLMMDEGDTFRLSAGLGLFANRMGQLLGVDSGVMGYMVKHKSVLNLDDYATWPGRLEDSVYNHTHAILAVPLMRHETLAGVIGLAHTESDIKFDESAKESLSRFSELATVAIDNARLYQHSQDELQERINAQSALQHNQANLRALIENTDDMIWSIDTEYRVVIKNSSAEDGFARIYGAKLQQGEHIIEMLPAHARGNSVEFYHRALAGERFTFEQRIDLDDSHFVYELSFNPIINTKGEVTGVTCFAHDITFRIDYERKLVNARDAAESANRAKSTFLANMSHELRTPLNAIIGYSEMLVEEVDEDGAISNGEDLNKILSAGNHLLELVSSVLDLSKIDAGRMDVFYETVNIGELFASIVAVINPVAAANGNQLIIERDPSADIMEADLLKLRQVLLNLLSNASKFTRNGEVKLSARKTADEHQVEWMLFTVADTGIGMTKDQMQTVFDAFTQADASTTRKYGGTGLGLTISREFSRLMGGDIHVESEPEHGTVFTVYLPVHKPSTETIDALEATQEVQQVTPGPRPTESVPNIDSATTTVLFLSESEERYRILDNSLKIGDAEVVYLPDATDIISFVEKESPVAIVVDMMAQDQNAWAIVAEIKSEPSTALIPIELLAYDARQGLILEVADFLSRPIDRQSFLMQVENALLRITSASDPARKNALIVSEDDDLSEVLAHTLHMNGWEIELTLNLDDARQALSDNWSSVILVDADLPNGDAFKLIQQMRFDLEHKTAIMLMLNSMASHDTNKAMTFGALQELGKQPLPIDQLMAQLSKRIQALIN